MPKIGRCAVGVYLGLVAAVATSPPPARAQEFASFLAAGTAARAGAASVGAQKEPSPAEQNGDQRRQKPGLHPGQNCGWPYELGFQTTLIDQQLFKFHSPYEGPRSFRSRSENEKTDTYTLYLGVHPLPNLELYVDPEMARGNGLSETVGLGGYVNGDIIRVGVSMEPYLARYMFRYTIATGHGLEPVDEGENQIAGVRPAHRLVITGGKLDTVDLFDVNSYANSTRTQFMNWTLINNGAYDYAADTRGYTQGAAIEWIHPTWAVRYGFFKMPTHANGPHLSGDLIHNRGDNVELELHVAPFHTKDPLVLRLLGYRNFAQMGRYRDALALAAATGAAPDITRVEKRGAVKYGCGLNWEQPLADGGATALFGRFGWNDGATESFVFTEVDRTISVGYQLSGAHWRRPKDHVALALVQNDLSAPHKEYLEAGGIGFQLGDGKLSYGPERILETYYAYQIMKPAILSLDYQFIANPGYNQDRGPVSVVSGRLHVEF